jgi:hypothetical protein
MLWLPEAAPSVVIVDRASAGFDITTSLDGSAVEWSPLKHSGARTQEFQIADETGRLVVQPRSEQAFRRPAILLPLDAMFELRLDIALRLTRRLRGGRVKLLPATLRLTPLQRTRLIQLLHAFDVHDAGGGPRDVAAEVLSSDQAQLPSIEWKDSHTRRKANRLIHDAVILVKGDYLKLLRGG